jgi:hypothetical protein
MRSPLKILALIALPASASGQGVPGTNVVVDVNVGPLSREGDTTTVRYIVRNRPQSLESLFTFTVDAPAPPIAIETPLPAEDWATFTDYRGRSVADWTVLGDRMAPGDSSPVLQYRAIGLPTIVSYWARGYQPPPPLTEADTLPVVQPTDPLTSNSVPGSTVGVEPYPADLSAVALLSRLRGLLDESCSLAWASGPTCSSLDARLAQAAGLLPGDVAGTIAAVEQFLSEVETARETPATVNDATYWLVRVNGEYALEVLEGLLPTLEAWNPNTFYAVGAQVSYQGGDYECRQAHTSQVGWEPPSVYALWARINSGETWAPQVLYQTGDEVVYQGVRYRAVQGHQSQPGWEPPNVPTLWTIVS